MLKCREVAKMANDYIDKELPWHQSMAMGLHLSMCKHCSGFVRKLRLVITVVQKQAPESISDEEAEEIATRVLATAGSDNHGAANPTPCQKR